MIEKRFTVIAVAFFACCFVGVSHAAAQEFRIEVGEARGILIADDITVAPIGVDVDDDEQVVDAEQGAVLKTDPDLEVSLETAERFKNDGNYRIATQLWQEVLKRCGDALYSSDGMTYFSLVRQVEQVLAELPPEGLSAYRVIADAEAKEILAEANDPNDITALNKVVRQYFISSAGDDAAYRLGCIYLDTYDFIGARRMFEKIIKHYPDPSVDLIEVRTRIALCQSFLGELDAAQYSIEVARESGGNSNQLQQIESSLGKLSSDKSTSIVDGDWMMRLGDSRRYGVMPAVPETTMDSDLVAVWQYYFEPRDKYKSSDAKGGLLSGKNSVEDEVGDTLTPVEERMIKSWKEKTWRPAGHLLFSDNRVYFKSAADLAVWETDAVAQMSKQSEKRDLTDVIQWRSLWRNSFEVDAATQMIQTIRRSWGGYGRRGNQDAKTSDFPETVPEVQFFGDGIYQQMSIHDGVVYSIEGKRFNEQNKKRAAHVTPQWNASFRRTRTNFLTAYDAESGDVQWTLPKQDNKKDDAAVEPDVDQTDWLEGGGFMASPIGFDQILLAPVNRSGSIWIYALDPNKEGKTIWKSFLCDEPESGAEAWSAINLTIEGSDLFVNSGMGVVFVLDPATGMVRFAKRYARVGKPDEFRRQSGWTVNRLNFSGWSSDVIVPYGRQMICFSSDAQVIQALDRNTGEKIWHSDMTPIGYKVDYLLGVYNDVLYAAGKETIIAYDLKGEGRMLWGAEHLFKGKTSFGRGALTPEGIYMPVEDSIYHFSLAGEKGQGHLLGRVQVDLGTEAPVGNLYSDGDRFWVHGGNRLYMLGAE